MIGVSVDTFVILTLNALVVISTMYTEDGAYRWRGYSYDKTNLAQTAFASAFGDKIGPMFVAICLFFAFSTILGWNMFSRQDQHDLPCLEKSVKVYTKIALCIFSYIPRYRWLQMTSYGSLRYV